MKGFLFRSISFSYFSFGLLAVEIFMRRDESRLLMQVSADEECFVSGVRYLGTDLEIIKTSNATECQMKCNQKYACFYFTYDVNMKTCTMKDINGMKLTEESPYSTSGPRKCPASNCLLEGVKFIGNDVLKKMNIKSANVCQMYCLEHPKCFFFTYVKPEKLCVLMNTYTSTVEKGQKDKFCVSGPQECAKSCFNEKFGYQGHIVSAIEGVSNSSMCQMLCQNHEECFYFTYMEVEKVCYLKGSNAVLLQMEEKFSISGPEKCPNTECLAFRHGREYVGHNVLLLMEITSVDLCMLECQHHANCFFFTYETLNNICYLKDANAMLGEQPKVGVVSGPQECPYSGCFFLDIKYLGRDVKVVYHAGSSSGCQIECQKHAECYHFTYSIGDGTCHLKSINAPGDESNSPNFVSGPKVCRNARGRYHLSRDYRGLKPEMDDFLFTEINRGFVNYVSKEKAQKDKLIYYESEGRVIIRPNATNVLPPDSGGRDSVRITAKEGFDDVRRNKIEHMDYGKELKKRSNGLWVIKLKHMPSGCGIHSTISTNGISNTIDIVTGMTVQTIGRAALHTTEECTMHNLNSLKITGNWTEKNCENNGGCAIEGHYLDKSWKDGLGGYYVMELDRSHAIRVWYFSFITAPRDLINNEPRPNRWMKGLFAQFPLKENCPGARNFVKQRITIDLSFCEASSAWSSMCPGECEPFVRENPAIFRQTYWEIDYVQVYQKRAKWE